MRVVRPPTISVIAVALALAACGSDSTTSLQPSESEGGAECSIPVSQIFDGGPGKDGIPALTDPTLVSSDDPSAAYLRDDDRVIAVEFDGGRVAVPLNIMWWHEIVNLQVGTHTVAVTHCPLTGSSLVFDRAPLGGAELGVSGLLYRTNLIMYDRTTEESLWPQMARAAVCGPKRGGSLNMLPGIEMTWAAWREMYPDGSVIGSDTGHPRNYQFYGYGRYDEVDNGALLFPLPDPVDTRRPPKERVLAVRLGGDGGMAFPFGKLEARGDFVVVETAFGGTDVVVFWDSEAQAAMAFRPFLEDGTQLSFRTSGDGFVDDETGSVWNVAGRAVEGPLASERLDPVAEAYVSFWFAWASFHPETFIWGG